MKIPVLFLGDIWNIFSYFFHLPFFNKKGEPLNFIKITQNTRLERDKDLTLRSKFYIECSLFHKIKINKFYYQSLIILIKIGVSSKTCTLFL